MPTQNKNGYVRWQMMAVIIALFVGVVMFLLNSIAGVQAEVRETRSEFLQIQRDVSEIKADVKFIILQLGYEK